MGHDFEALIEVKLRTLPLMSHSSCSFHKGISVAMLNLIVGQNKCDPPGTTWAENFKGR